jgi:hypothetical protein
MRLGRLAQARIAKTWQNANAKLNALWILPAVEIKYFSTRAVTRRGIMPSPKQSSSGSSTGEDDLWAPGRQNAALEAFDPVLRSADII